MTNISLYKINKYRSKLQSVNYDNPSYQLYLDKYIYYLEGSGGPGDPPVSQQVSEPAPDAKLKKSVFGNVYKGTKSVTTAAVKVTASAVKSTANTAAKVVTTAAKGAAAISKAYKDKRKKLEEAIQKRNPGPAMQAAVELMYDTAKTESLAFLSGINLDPTENNILKIDLNKDIWKTVATKLITSKIQNNETVKKLKGEYDQALKNIEKIKKIPAQIASHGDAINAAMMSANILLSGITDITKPANIASLEKELNKIIAINNPSFATQPPPKSGNARRSNKPPVNTAAALTAGINAGKTLLKDPNLERLALNVGVSKRDIQVLNLASQMPTSVLRFGAQAALSQNKSPFR